MRWLRSEIEGMNLTGRVRPGRQGRIVDLANVNDVRALERDAVVIIGPDQPPTEGVRRHGLEPLREFSFTQEPSLYRPLATFLSLARVVSPSYTYVADAGTSPFPGRTWRVYVRTLE